MILLYLAVIELSFECQQTLTIIASTLVDTMVSSTPPLRDRLALLVLFYLDIIEASCAPRSSFLAPGQGRRGVFHGLHWRSAGSMGGGVYSTISIGGVDFLLFWQKKRKFVRISSKDQLPLLRGALWWRSSALATCL